MLKGKQLVSAYNEFIVNFSIEKNLEKKTVLNKRQALDGLIPFLGDKPLIAESCRAYAVHKFEQGWSKPNSRKNVTIITEQK